MSASSKVTRKQIKNLIQKINRAENARPDRTVEETIAEIDTLMAADVEGWLNGEHRPNRSAEREIEKALFAHLDDYHRDIERVVIDPPFASFAWCMHSAKRNLLLHGCSIIEVNEAGLGLRYWIYCDPAPLQKLALSGFIRRNDGTGTDELNADSQGNYKRKAFHLEDGRMEITARRVGKCIVLDCSGPITFGSTSLTLRKAMREAFQDDTSRVVLNLANVGLMDSCGLGEMIGGYVHLKNRGIQPLLMNISERVLALITKTRLRGVLDICDDEQKALKDCG